MTTANANGQALHHFTLPFRIGTVRCPGCYRSIDRPVLPAPPIVCCVKFSFSWDPPRKDSKSFKVRA